MTHPFQSANNTPEGVVVSDRTFSVRTTPGPAGTSPPMKKSWQYSLDRNWVMVDDPLGRTGGEPVTSELLTRSGYAGTPGRSWSCDGWAMDVYERTGNGDLLICLSTGLSTHLITAKGLPSALKVIGDLIPLVTPQAARVVSPAPKAVASAGKKKQK